MDMFGSELMVLRVCVVEMELVKEKLSEKHPSRFAIKRNCVWKTLSFQKRNKQK